MKSRESEAPSPHHELEARVLRRLRGELGAAEASRLEAELLADPAKAGMAERLERTWQNLELPPARFEPVAPLLLARLRGEELRWSMAPTWARAAASLALVAGLGAGYLLGGETRDIEDLRDLDAGGTETASNHDFFNQDEDSGFAESLWLAAEGFEPEETP